MVEQFREAFTLFGNCHKLYNKCEITEEEINELGREVLQ